MLNLWTSSENELLFGQFVFTSFQWRKDNISLVRPVNEAVSTAVDHQIRREQEQQAKIEVPPKTCCNIS